MKIYNLTNVIQTSRNLNKAFNIGLIFSLPLLLYPLSGLYEVFTSFNALALIFLLKGLAICSIYYFTLYSIRRGSKVATILLSLIISGTIIGIIISVFVEEFESNEDLVLNIIVAVIVFFLWIFPLYKSVKAVLKFSKEIDEVKKLKLGSSHLSYKGKESFRIIDALLLHFLAVLFFIFSFTAWIIGFIIWKAGYPIAVPIGLTFLGMGVLYGKKLLSLSKRNITDTISDIRKKDTRTPILLIRSFKDDNLKIEQGNFKISELLSPNSTLEETIVRGLSHFGPVIAIANPKDRLPPVGAAREYFDGDTWVSKIEDFMVESRYIVAILNTTTGLEYEFKKIYDLGLLNKLILIMPPVNEQDSLERWLIFVNLFNLDIDDKWLDVLNKECVLLKFNSEDIQASVICKDKKNDVYYFAINKILLMSSPHF